jgi:hypothetical protein
MERLVQAGLKKTERESKMKQTVGAALQGLLSSTCRCHQRRIRNQRRAGLTPRIRLQSLQYCVTISRLATTVSGHVAVLPLLL